MKTTDQLNSIQLNFYRLRSLILLVAIVLLQVGVVGQYTVHNNTATNWDVAIKYDSGNQTTVVTCSPGTTPINYVFDIVNVKVFCPGSTSSPGNLGDSCTGRVYDDETATCISGATVAVQFSHCANPSCTPPHTCDDTECTIFLP